MKIVTVNVPESYIDAIERLIGENGLYPSRSELIRVAVREFILKELSLARNMAKYNESRKDDDFEEFDEKDDNVVRIPVEKRNENNEPQIEFKTYKIVRSLSHSQPKTELKTSSKPRYTADINDIALKDRIERAKKPQGRYGANPWYDDVYENGVLKRAKLIDTLEKTELIEYLDQFEKVISTA